MSEVDKKGYDKIKAALAKNVQGTLGSAVKKGIDKKNERTASHTKGGKFSNV